MNTDSNVYSSTKAENLNLAVPSCGERQKNMVSRNVAVLVYRTKGSWAVYTQCFILESVETE